MKYIWNKNIYAPKSIVLPNRRRCYGEIFLGTKEDTWVGRLVTEYETKVNSFDTMEKAKDWVEKVLPNMVKEAISCYHQEKEQEVSDFIRTYLPDDESTWEQDLEKISIDIEKIELNLDRLKKKRDEIFSKI